MVEIPSDWRAKKKTEGESERDKESGRDGKRIELVGRKREREKKKRFREKERYTEKGEGW